MVTIRELQVKEMRHFLDIHNNTCSYLCDFLHYLALPINVDFYESFPMTDSSAAPRDIAELSFEDGMRELETIVKRLEGGDASLQQSITDYTLGTEGKAHCETRLKDAELKVRALTQNPDGSTSEQPFETS